jgi:hypothetical protein
MTLQTNGVRLPFNAKFSSKSYTLIEEIKTDCPWFFTMRDLIAERPNIIPTGIGNSTSVMDSSVLAGSNLDSEIEGTPDELGILTDSLARDDEGRHTTTGDEGRSEPLTDAPTGTGMGDSETPPPAHPTGSSSNLKRKQEDSSRSASASGLGGSNSKQRGPGASKKTKFEEFAGIAASEEQTRQKEIDLAKSKIVASAQVQVETQKAKVELKKAKVELERMKLESLAMKKDYKMERMRLKHEREMAKINQTLGAAAGASLGASTHGAMSESVASHAGPSNSTDSTAGLGLGLGSTASGTFYNFTEMLQSTDDAYFGPTQATQHSTEPSDSGHGLGDNSVE